MPVKQEEEFFSWVDVIQLVIPKGKLFYIYCKLNLDIAQQSELPHWKKITFINFVDFVASSTYSDIIVISI